MLQCEYCQKEHDGSYGSGRFCGSKCSRAFSTSANRELINHKRSLAVRSRFNYHTRLCPVCGVEFTVSDCKSSRVCCSRSCAGKERNRANPELLKQRASAGGRKSVVSQQRRSKNEIYFAELCQRSFKHVLCNEPIFDGWDADVILPDMKVAILWNGAWHYQKITEAHSLKQVQNRDRIKLGKIAALGYQAYVIKDMGRYNPAFVDAEFAKMLDVLNAGNAMLANATDTSLNVSV